MERIINLQYLIQKNASIITYAYLTTDYVAEVLILEYLILQSRQISLDLYIISKNFFIYLKLIDRHINFTGTTPASFKLTPQDNQSIKINLYLHRQVRIEQRGHTSCKHCEQVEQRKHCYIDYCI